VDRRDLQGLGGIIPGRNRGTGREDAARS
jgi:hypothetical protein